MEAMRMAWSQRLGAVKSRKEPRPLRGYSGSRELVVTLTGAVAQLGARLHGMEEVEGSNPFGSTI
jgi:hypothetical protein